MAKKGGNTDKELEKLATEIEDAANGSDNGNGETDDQAKPEEVKADEGIVSRENPKSLTFRIVTGNRERLNIAGVTVDALTDEGKFSRDAVYQIGRLSEEVALYELLEGDSVVATFSRGPKLWTVTIHQDAGDKVIRVERSKTKKPGKAGAGRIDSGPDLYKAGTALIGRLYPNMKQASGGRSSGRTKELESTVAKQNEQIAALLGIMKSKFGGTGDPELAELLSQFTQAE